MSEPSISVKAKPTKFITLKDWQEHINGLKDISDVQRKESNILRNESTQARNEAEIKSSWTRYYTNNRLSERISEVRQWAETLKAVKVALNEEIESLEKEKSLAEEEIEAYYRGLSVISQCLFTRDLRPPPDLTYDDPHKEIQVELQLLETSKALLTDKCTEAWERINQMNDLSTKLANDIADKEEALDIDMTALSLEKESSMISFKPDVLRIPLQIVTTDAWLQETQALQARADDEMKLSSKLRESIHLARERTRMDYLTQVEATNYTLRKHLHDANVYKNELQWQRKNVGEEISRVGDEIDRLRQCRAHEEGLLKCAETRCENRNLRPALELTRDTAQTTLQEEIADLRILIKDLIQKTQEAAITYNHLETLALKLDKEIRGKEAAINIDVRCLDARKNLLEHVPISKMDKDVVLVKMEKQIAPQPL